MTTQSDHRWALILAAGSGTRLSSLTTTSSGETVPKQFCSLTGGPSLLDRTLARAFRVVPWSRTVVVVAENHRSHWQQALPLLPPENVIVQPENKGTAVGILLPLLHILNHDPDADVVVLPSDHFVEREDVFADAVMRALAAVSQDITLLGITPDCADPELGYIVSGSYLADGRRRVLRFVEKPDREAAECLVAWDALWNSFVIVAQASEMVATIAERYPETVASLCHAVASGGDRCIASAYRSLPAIDFSADILAPNALRLRCLQVPPCGWTDLGTPHRVAECLARQRRGSATTPVLQGEPMGLNLAEAHRRRQTRIQPAYENQLLGEMS